MGFVGRSFGGRLTVAHNNNFGVHFSANNCYRHKGGGSNGLTKKGRYEVRAYIEQAEVNEAATKITRNEFPLENEVVLAFNQKIEAIVKIIEDGEFVGDWRGQKIQINTGTRCDEWVSKMKN